MRHSLSRVSSRTKILLAVVLVALLAVGGGIFWFLRDDAPEEVSLDRAIEGISTTTATPGSDRPAEDGSIEGTWTVDTTSGDFDFESATGTFVGFRIQENLASVGSTTAVGRTGAVSGSMKISGTQVTEASFEVDLTTITTNESLRDRRVQEALETDRFPTATFTLTSPIELGADAAGGGKISVTAKGDLTIHGVTKAVEFPLEAQLVEGTAVVVGSIEVTFSDFGVTVPSAPIVLSVDDFGKLELQLLLTRSS
jgi:polyisoprenoid-binding protein YceI